MDFGCEIREAQVGGIEPSQLMQGDVIEGAANGGIHSLPRAADATLPLDAAPARRTATFGDGDRSFEDIENLRRGNLLGSPREPISALRTPRGDHHASALQSLEHLAHGWQLEPGALCQFSGSAMPRRLLR